MFQIGQSGISEISDWEGARVVPEHRVTSKQYKVVAIIDTEQERVIDVYCEGESDGCKAAAGGCKHAVAFLFYLYEKYSSPSPTDSTCLWKIPTLARVAENIDNFDISTYATSGVSRIITSSGDGRGSSESDSLIETLLEKYPQSYTNTALKYRKPLAKKDSYSMHNLMLDFK